MHINMHRSNCIDLTSSIHHSPLMIVRYVKILTLVNLLACSICASQTKHVVSVPATDGILLDGTYYVPSTPAPNGGFPVIIFVHGFAMSKDETDASARIYAQMGYLTFTYSVRGHGNSQGLCTIMSFKERDDLRTVLGFGHSCERLLSLNAHLFALRELGTLRFCPRHPRQAFLCRRL